MQKKLKKLVLVMAMVALMVSGLAPAALAQPGALEPKGETKYVTIRVTGEPGVSFSGNYSIDGTPIPIEGLTPQDFDVEVRPGIDGVWANMQKLDEGDGEVKLQGIVDGQVIKEDSVTAKNRMAWIALWKEDIAAALAPAGPDL